jgi:anti-sigma-K factor RskA
VDVQRYISSGIIESYVVGLVSEREAREVENAIAEFPEIRAAVEACRQDMELYVELSAVKPPKAIRTRILNAIENETQPEGEQLLPEELRRPDAAEGAREKALKMPALNINSAQTWLYVAIAAFLLLIVSVICNFYYAGQYKTYLQKTAALAASEAALTRQTKAYQARQEALEKELNLLKDPALKWTRLSGTGKHTGQLAAIAWNTQSKEVYLLALSLPEPPADQQYQLWAVVNGKPVDAGVFEMGQQQHALQKMKEVAAAQVFIITLEKKGGNTTPALNQVFLSGKANS